MLVSCGREGSRLRGTYSQKLARLVASIAAVGTRLSVAVVSAAPNLSSAAAATLEANSQSISPCPSASTWERHVCEVLLTATAILFL